MRNCDMLHELEMLVDEASRAGTARETFALSFAKEEKLKYLEQKLDTSSLDGLPKHDNLALRQSTFGVNFVAPSLSQPYYVLVWEALKDETIIMLIVAAFVSFALSFAVGEDYVSSWIESGAILLAVVVVVNVAASTEYFKEKEFRR